MFFILDETHWIIGNELLPNCNFPLIFDSVDGKCRKEHGGTSYFNEEEVLAAVSWVQKFIGITWKGRQIGQHDIGVVTPYKKQCQLIREDLWTYGCDGVTVGSAEIFQGQERRIMVISTVRNGNDLGFVNDSQVRLFKLFYFHSNSNSCNIFSSF